MACPASPLTSLVASQKQKAGREGCGEGDMEEPAEHWWPPEQGQSDGLLLAINVNIATNFNIATNVNIANNVNSQ